MVRTSPTDSHRVVKLPPLLFERVGEMAAHYNTTRPLLVAMMLELVLTVDNGEVLDVLMGEKNDCDDNCGAGREYRVD
jgi:hypothetical protein